MITKELAKTLLADYLKDLGINTEKNFSCIAGTHEDRNPSMSLNKKDHYIKCFSCNEVFDIFKLVKLHTGITDFKKQLAYIDDWYNKKTDISKNNSFIRPNTSSNLDKTTSSQIESLENLTDYFYRCHENLKDTTYLTDRGITDQQILHDTLVGYDPNYKDIKAIVFPTSAYSCTYRNTDTSSSKRVLKHQHSEIFNRSAFINPKVHRPIFVVEGEIDCLSILQAGGLAISIGGTSGVKLLVNTLKGELSLRKESLLNTDLILALDNDTAGSDANDKLVDELKHLSHIRFIVADSFKLYQGSKDANDSLLLNQDNFSKLLQYYETNFNSLYEDYILAERTNYINEFSSSRYLTAFFNGITSSVDTPFLSTGFKKLDKALDGGLYEGLYFVGAISSLGKTTFALQMADKIALQGNDVLIISLEMARNELIAKSISRESYRFSRVFKKFSSKAKTVRDITTKTRYNDYDEIDLQLINESLKFYNEYSDNIFIYEGIGDIGVYNIRSFVENHITTTHKKPVVIIDYIQILEPYDTKASDKTNTDKAVLELKRLSRDFKIPIIGISSFNRANYKEEVNMSAFKESGAIEYGSDVLIGLQLKRNSDKSYIDIESLKTLDPRPIELVVLKNRNGVTGTKIEYNYYPKYNYFEEK